ncbi:hypothetical protein [Campylobacter troglodytis]|uniref:hypothetical protein n=1 Tax=Campylobacter troglodytis TaxID=654363 RepID=UPI00115B9F14|nr:hypothetical protein [Campylobacter troglodytis]
MCEIFRKFIYFIFKQIVPKPWGKSGILSFTKALKSLVCTLQACVLSTKTLSYLAEFSTLDSPLPCGGGQGGWVE